MSNPDPLQIARCLYPEFAADRPSKGFASTVPLTFSLLAILLTVAQTRVLSLPPEDMIFIIGLILTLTVVMPSLIFWDSIKHTKDQSKALKEAHKLIAIVYLDPNFQIKRVGNLLELSGLPKSSTPILTHSFTGLEASVTETEFIAIAPLLEPLRNRFQ